MEKPICLIKTEGEWDVIAEVIKKMGKTNLNSFIAGEVRRLGNAYVECPKCISQASGVKIIKRPKIPLESYKKIERIASQMHVPVSTVVDILIILPLLQGKASEQQPPIPQKQH